MTTEPPLTRSELREELDRTLRAYATKEDLAMLRADFERMRAETYRWMYGAMMTTIVVGATAIGVISQL